MKTKHFLDLYTDSVEHNHGAYTALELHGVQNNGQECWIDDDNPQFFSIYARHADGSCLVCADASADWLNELRAVAKDLASKYNWKYQDFTLDQECWIDDDNPQFFSIFAKHADGTCLVCADASNVVLLSE